MTMNATVTPLTKPGESTTLTRASAQWRDRPADERYDSIQALRDAANLHRERSSESLIRLNEGSMSYSGDELFFDGKTMNHWAFGQLASKLQTPGSYMRKLPTDLAFQCMKHGLKQLPPDDTQNKLLITPDHKIGAFTSERYVRIWNAEIAEWLLELQAAQPYWTFPIAFRQAGGEQVAGAWGEEKELPVAFLSDHDMFVFLTDLEHSVEIPGAANALLRGFWIENSEVGGGAVRLTMFLYDFVCSNVLVWGARNVVEVRVNHTGRARERVLFDDSEAKRAIESYANRDTSADTQRIVTAQRMLVADTVPEVIDLMYGKRLPGITRTVLEQATAAAERTPRYGNPCSVWALINGLTEVSQRSTFADERVEIDRSAGRILDVMVPLED